MSAQAAVVPVTDVRSERASAGRMAIVAVACLAIVIAGSVYPLVSPIRDMMFTPPTPLGQAFGALTATTWLAVLLGSMARQPGGRLWKLILLYLVTNEITALEFVPDSLVWSVQRVIDGIPIAVLIQLLVAYPSGDLRTRFDRGIVVFGYAVIAVWSLNQLLLWGEWEFACNPSCVRNLFVIWPHPELYEWLRNAITVVALVSLFPLVLLSIWRHWHLAGAAARRTLMPLVVAVPLLVGSAAADVGSAELDFQPGIDFFNSPSGQVVRLIVPAILPIGFLLGILRARWSRGRIAGLVVELGRGVPVGGLREVLSRTLGDPTLQLAFAAPSGAGFVDAAGQPIDLPVADPSRTATRLEREGELLGVLVHDPAIDAEDPGLVEAVGNAARLALENERLAAEVRAQLGEVRASRARIVEAADAERRRVERDLHDGAQQRLVALAIRLQMAKETTPGASALLDEATGEIETAIGEVRGLARGIHPTILTEAGLRAAVDALAERTPLPVTVDVPDARYARHVEATAYFVVSEALTNVARYAQATEARVSAVEEAGRLIVSIVDDGAGGADPAAGSGLRGLADRLAALDGHLAISSPSGGGTTVTADLPLDVHARTTSSAPRLPTPATALATARSTAQIPAERRRGMGLQLSNPIVLIGVVTAGIAGTAVAAAMASMQQSPPDNGRADTFVRPFDYQVPAGSDIKLDAKSNHLHVLLPPGRPGGISIWAVDDVLVDHCDWDPNGPPGPVRSRQAGVEGLLAYLRSVERLRVEEIGRITIDGRRAVRVDLTVVNGGSGCVPPSIDHLLLWRDTSPNSDGAMQVPAGHRVPLSILDVDGATIAIEIWSGGRIENWLPTAEPIVESIRFLYRPPAEPVPTNSSTP